MRVGYGFDAHRLVSGRPFVVGGERIPSERGPVGHSDADVLIHALCDALLGACALGDLGTHFPSSDEQWKDADSLVFLKACLHLLRAGRFRIVNVDATVVVQKPHLETHLPNIRARLARVLELEASSISVKAKSSDGLGYTGDGSGMCAYAVACVEQG